MATNSVDSPLVPVPEAIVKFLKHKQKEIKNIFPETWTHTANINWLGVGFKLKVVGFDWKSQDELAIILSVLERERLILREGVHLIKANHLDVYEKVSV
jgi:hypothetical protein